MQASQHVRREHSTLTRPEHPENLSLVVKLPISVCQLCEDEVQEEEGPTAREHELVSCSA